MVGRFGHLEWVPRPVARGGAGGLQLDDVGGIAGSGPVPGRGAEGSRGTEIGRGAWRGRGEISGGGGFFKKKKRRRGGRTKAVGSHEIAPLQHGLGWRAVLLQPPLAGCVVVCAFIGLVWGDPQVTMRPVAAL